MKRRTRRDIGILLGVVVILGSIVFFNMTLNRTSLANEMDRWRRSVESQRRADGMDLLSWSLMRKTKGSLRKGGTFDAELKVYHQEPVNLMGFMVPEEQFRQVTEFLLLPLPIECYFCQIPPARDVMLVQLAEGETADIYEEPILVHGTLSIHEEAGAKFFYRLKDATLGPGEMDGSLSRRKLKLQHMLPKHEQDPADMLEPYQEPDDSE